MKTNEEKTSQKKTNEASTPANAVRRILGDERYDELLKSAEGATFFGMSLGTLDPESVMVAFAFLGETMEREKEVRRKSAAFIAKLNDLRNNLSRASRGESIAPKNPFKPGDFVEILHELRDAYSEVWHDKGEVLEVKSIAKDGEGLMFHSDLGIHFTQVKPARDPENKT